MIEIGHSISLQKISFRGDDHVAYRKSYFAFDLETFATTARIKWLTRNQWCQSENYQASVARISRGIFFKVETESAVLAQ
ncbi:MAG: hypothetical protein WCH39_29495, partial [Schlesneria sp.]